jgi:hypothetical protein
MTEQNIRDKLSTEVHRESFLGGHFFSVYNECPRKFFMRYVCGLKAVGGERHFVRGQAIHSGLEYFFTYGKDPEVCLKTAQTYMELNRRKLGDAYEDDYDLVSDMLTEWVKNNSERYSTEQSPRVLACEQESMLTLPNGFQLTVRFDRVEEDSYGRICIIDTKTTGRSFSSAYDGLLHGDQAISYCIAGQQAYGELFRGVIGEVLVGKMLKAGPVSSTHLTPRITYGTYPQQQYMIGMIGLISEITQKVKALRFQMYPAELLFYRKTDRCSWLGCEYRDICRRNIQPENPLPGGFVRDEWFSDGTLQSFPTPSEMLDQMLDVLPTLDKSARITAQDELFI